MYDSRDRVSETAHSPSPLSSLTYVHRFIGYRNPTNKHFMTTSARLMYLSMYEKRDSVSEHTPSPSPWRSSLTYVHNIHTPTLPTSTLLTITCTQVLWFIASLTRYRVSCV